MNYNDFNNTDNNNNNNGNNNDSTNPNNIFFGDNNGGNNTYNNASGAGNTNFDPNYQYENAHGNQNSFNPLYQKLHKKPFMVLMIGIGIALAVFLTNILIQIATIDTVVAEMMDMMATAGAAGMVDESFFRGAMMFGFIFGLSLWLVYYGLMLFFIFRHKRSNRKGTYLTVMYVISIILTITNAIGLLAMFTNFNIWSFLFAIAQLCAQIIIIIAAKMQSKIVLDRLN